MNLKLLTWRNKSILPSSELSICSHAFWSWCAGNDSRTKTNQLIQFLYLYFFISTDNDEQELHQGTNQQELIQISEYYFDGQGKALRPMVTMLMGKAINYHMHRENRFVNSPCWIHLLTLSESLVWQPADGESIPSSSAWFLPFKQSRTTLDHAMSEKDAKYFIDFEFWIAFAAFLSAAPDII